MTRRGIARPRDGPVAVRRWRRSRRCGRHTRRRRRSRSPFPVAMFIGLPGTPCAHVAPRMLDEVVDEDEIALLAAAAPYRQWVPVLERTSCDGRQRVVVGLSGPVDRERPVDRHADTEAIVQQPSHVFAAQLGPAVGEVGRSDHRGREVDFVLVQRFGVERHLATHRVHRRRRQVHDPVRSGSGREVEQSGIEPRIGRHHERLVLDAAASADACSEMDDEVVATIDGGKPAGGVGGDPGPASRFGLDGTHLDDVDLCAVGDEAPDEVPPEESAAAGHEHLHHCDLPSRPAVTAPRPTSADVPPSARDRDLDHRRARRREHRRRRGAWPASPNRRRRGRARGMP